MQLNVRVSMTDRGALGPKFTDRLNAFRQGVVAARRQAAATATNTSRSNVRRIRDQAPVRPGRYHGLRDAIKWGLQGKGPDDAAVGLALKELNEKFPPWLVQEIGTGQRATQKVAGRPNPVGRPAKGASYAKTVRSQRGRKITPGLVFASRGGRYSAPGASRTQQLYLRSQVTGAPARFDAATQRSAPGIVIKREIKGQHFIQKGGQEGFREYRESVLTAARSQLKKRRT